MADPLPTPESLSKGIPKVSGVNLPEPDHWKEFTDISLEQTPAHQEAKRQQAEALGSHLTDEQREEWLNAHRHLSMDEIMGMKEAHIPKFMSVFTKANTHADVIRESALAGHSKRGWYQNASRMIAELFPHRDDRFRFTALLAAFSRTSPEANLRLALDVWKAWNDQGRTLKTRKEVQDWLKDLSEEWDKAGGAPNPEGGPPLSRKGGTAKFGSYKNAVPNALLYKGDDWLNDFKHETNKVDSFYQNLLGNMQRVTSDVWDARVKQLNPNKDIATKGPSGTAMYLGSVAATRRVVSDLNKTLGPSEPRWTPAEVQETAWSLAKTLSELNDKHRKTKDPFQVLLSMTHGDISNTVDFVSEVAQNDDILTRLRGLGLGEAARRISEVYRDFSSQQAKSADEPAIQGDHPVLGRLSHYLKGLSDAGLKAGQERRAAKKAARPVKLSAFLMSLLRDI